MNKLSLIVALFVPCVGSAGIRQPAPGVPTPRQKTAVVYVPFDSLADVVRLEQIGPVWFRRLPDNWDRFNSQTYELYLDRNPWERVGGFSRSAVQIGELWWTVRELPPIDCAPNPQITREEMLKKSERDRTSKDPAAILPPPNDVSFPGFEYTRTPGDAKPVSWPCLKAR